MHTYESGSWIACVGPHAVAMVPGTVGVDAATAAWAALTAGGLVGFIDALAVSTRSTVTSLPPFAVAIAASDGVRLGVRGDVLAADPSGARAPVSGTGVTGWNEALWPPGSEAVLTAIAEPAGLTLHVDKGVVLARSVALGSSVLHAPAPPLAAPLISVPAEQAPRADVSTEPPVNTLPPAVEFLSGSGGEAEAVAPDAPAGVSVETLLIPDGDDEAGPDDGDFGVWGWTVTAEDIASSAMAPVAAPHAPVPDAPPARIDAVPPVVPLSQPPSQPPSQPSAPGDHDGATISVAALRELAGSPQEPPRFATPEELAKERSGRAVLSTGAIVTLDRNVIVGRQPKAARITGEMPHLIAVPSPEQDISRNHLELRVTDTVVVAVDLDTTNGSVLIRAGAEPVRLHPGEPAVVLSGDVIDLGDNITMTFEDLP